MKVLQITAAFILLIASYAVHGDSLEGGSLQEGPTQGNIIKRITEKSRELSQLSGRFVQSREIKAIPLPLKSSGTFRYDAKEGVLWKTLQPIDTEVTISQDGLSTRSSDNQARALSGSTFLAEILMGIFSGDMTTLAQYFSIEAQTINESGWQLRLTPLSPAVAKYMRSIEMAGTDYVEHLSLLEANGGSTHIALEIDQAVEKSAQ